MLRFFRQIRKNLLETAGIKKYLFYAIGEILLVVIGILIALQVSNWNQERQLVRLSENYELRILDDLLQEKAIVEGVKNYESAVSEHAYRAIRVFENRKELTREESDQFIIDLYQASQILNLVDANSVYQELISSGQIGLIQDETIRTNLVRYYDVNWAENFTLVEESGYRETLRKAMPSYIQEEIRRNCDDIYVKARGQYIAILPETCGVTFEEEIARREARKLLNNEAVEADLRFLIGNLNSHINVMTELMNLLNELITPLEETR